MTSIGVFRDDFYNAIQVLPQSQQAAFTTQQTAALLPATDLCGAGDCYVTYSGFAVAQSQTTDTALNIIAYLQSAVATQYKAQLTSFGAGVNPPIGVPNLFNLSWTVSLINQNTASGALTLTAGTGVTLATSGTASATVVAIATTAIYVVQVNSPTTVVFTRVQ